MQAETVGSAIAWAAAKLRAARVDSPRLAAEVLLGHVLQWDRARILGHVHDPLRARSLEEFQALVCRSAQGEPLHYLTGEREFYGLPFLVTTDVLIPRPETEILVEKAVDLARVRAGALRFADVGTGSGCIAASVARQLPDARGWATDRSERALAVARENSRRLGVEARLGFVCCDLLECFPPKALFDFILSNPPYISGSEMAGLPRTVREYEPRAALDGGESGLDLHSRLVPQAACRLAAAGCLLLEIGAGQAHAVEELIDQAGLALTESIRDLQGIPRCLVARRIQ